MNIAAILGAVGAEFAGLGETVGGVSSATEKLAKHTKDAAEVYTSAVKSVRDMGNALNTLYTSHINATQSLTGLGYSTTLFNEQLNKLSQTTNHSKSEIMSFYTQLTKLHEGFKDLSAIAETQRLIAGVTINSQNAAAATQEFISAQRQVVDLDEKMASGARITMAERQRLGAVTSTLVDQMKAYKDYGITQGDPAEVEHLRQIEKLNKSWEDLTIRLKQSFIPVLNTIADMLTTITNMLNGVAKFFPDAAASLPKIDFGNRGANQIPNTDTGGGYTGAQMVGSALGGLGILRIALAANRRLVNRGGGRGEPIEIDDEELGPPPEPGFFGRIGKRANNIVGSKMFRGGVIGGAALLALSPAIEAGYKNYISPHLDEHDARTLETVGSYGKSALSYGMTGAMLGSTLGPIGTLIGGAAGGAYGLYQKYNEDDAKKAAAEAAKAKPVGRSDAEKAVDTELMQKSIRATMDSVLSGKTSGSEAIAAMSGTFKEDTLKQAKDLEDKGYIEEAEKLKKLANDTQAMAARAKNQLLEGLAEANAKANAFMQAIGGAASSYRELAEISEKIGYDSSESTKMFAERFNLQKQMIPVIQEQLTAQKAITDAAIKELNEAGTPEQKIAAQKSVTESRAREQEYAARLKETEVDMMKSRQDAMLAGVRVQKELNTVSKDYADAQEQLSANMRVGFGASYAAIRQTIQVRAEGLKIAQQEVETWKKIAESANTEQERRFATVELQKKQTDLMRQQADYMQKINDLRVGYIDSLGSLSLGGLSSEFNPTKEAGMVFFMGMGKNKGASAVGGMGGPGGRSDYAANMSFSGQITPGAESNDVNSYAYDKQIMSRFGSYGAMVRTGVVNNDALISTSYKNPSDVPGNAMGQMGSFGGMAGGPAGTQGSIYATAPGGGSINMGAAMPKYNVSINVNAQCPNCNTKHTVSQINNSLNSTAQYNVTT